MGRCFAVSHTWKRVSGPNRHGHSKGVRPEQLNSQKKGVSSRGSLACCLCLTLVQRAMSLHSPTWSTAMWAPHGITDSNQPDALPEPAATRSFRTLALLLALLGPQRHLSQDWLKDMGTVEPKEGNSLQIEPFSTPPSSVGAPDNAYGRSTPRTPLPRMTGQYSPLISLVTPDTLWNDYKVHNRGKGLWVQI